LIQLGVTAPLDQTAPSTIAILDWRGNGCINYSEGKEMFDFKEIEKLSREFDDARQAANRIVYVITRRIPGHPNRKLYNQVDIGGPAAEE